MLDCEVFSLSIAIDANEVIYRCDLGPQAYSENERHEFARFQSQVLNQKISYALNLRPDEFFSHGEEQRFFIEKLLYALRVQIRDYQGADIARIDTDPNVDFEKIVCRCAYVDEKRLIEAFEKHFGQFKSALLETHAGQTCSKCLDDVRSLYQRLNFEKIDEQERTLMKEIQEQLDQFALFCPQDYAHMTYRITHAKGATLKIRIGNKAQGLSRQEITKTLSNYLSDILKSDYALSVYF